MLHFKYVVLLGVVAPSMSAAQLPSAAEAFGTRQDVEHISLSPDGSKVAIVSPTKGQGNALMTVDLNSSAIPRATLVTSDKGERLGACEWVSNVRIVCVVWTVLRNKNLNVERPFETSRIIALNSDGSNLKILSNRQGANAAYYGSWGGQIVDLLPGDDGAVLMGRWYVPESDVGSLVKKVNEGFGVDRLDTITLKSSRVIAPNVSSSEYISDGLGTVRIKGFIGEVGAGNVSSTTKYSFRKPASDKWEPLSAYDFLTREGFNPFAVEPVENVAYGFEKTNGRAALYKVKLDGSNTKSLVFAHPQVDVDGLITVGRKRRVIGVSYATDSRYAHYFDPEFAKLLTSLAKALPGTPQISFQGESADGNQLIIRASSDVNPGIYYHFDRRTRALRPLLPEREALEQVKLAPVRSVIIKAADGAQIPGYLTLPLGSKGKKLPGIVMPHGGPGARDEWGFDWLSQFYANRGFAVLQPNFRGSTGYGDDWFQKNGFQSWRTAIGDVNDSGKWLLEQGIVDPTKLAILGWSYGGYAALQSTALDPNLFKAIVAIAPVTDLVRLRDAEKGYANYRNMERFIGTGPNVTDGSPIRHAEKFKAPVQLFHGDLDVNVSVFQTHNMVDSLRSAGKLPEVHIYKGLDHYLQDSKARADMLSKSEAFLKRSLGM